jgi:GcrA cell cycle regulator
MTFPWTDAQIETLRTMWQDGHSATQIAAELSEHVAPLTRNAVLGKIHRMGFAAREKKYVRPRSSPHPKPRQRKAQPGPDAKPRLSLQGKSKGLALWLAGASQPMPAEPDIVIPIEQRRALLDLTDETCRWPVGDPLADNFYFCGAEPAAGAPYCAGHCRVAYQPKKERSEAQKAHDARMASIWRKQVARKTVERTAWLAEEEFA